MRDILPVLLGGNLLGIVLTLLFQYLQASSQARKTKKKELTAAEMTAEATSYSLLVNAYQKMVMAEKEWAQKEVELKTARFIAEEKLVRMKEDWAREIKEERRLAIEQNEEILDLQCKIEVKDTRIKELEDVLRSIGVDNEA